MGTVLSVLLNLIFIGIVLFWMFRFLCDSGLPVPVHAKRKGGDGGSRFSGVSSFLLRKYRYKGENCTFRELAWIFLLAVLFRIGIYIVSLLIAMMFSEETGMGPGKLAELWNKWDSPHYIELAKNGYAEYTEEGQHLFLVFFPLFPWALKVFHLLTGWFIKDWYLSGMVLSTICYAFGCCFFYAIGAEEYGKDIAKKAVVLISVFPFAFFFGGVMTESLFFLTVAAGFYYIRRHDWIVVGFIGFFASLCRVHGVLLLGVAGVEFFTYYQPAAMFRQKKGTEFLKILVTQGIWLLLIPVGDLIYLRINYNVEGDYFRFRVYQSEHWYHDNTWFTNAVREIAKRALHPDTTNTMKMCVWYPEVFLFVITIALLIYGLRRHPLKYTAYLFVFTIVNYSVTFLISGGRYMLCALPLFWIGAEALNRHKRWYPLVAALSAVLMAVYLTGYLQGKQIM